MDPLNASQQIAFQRMTGFTVLQTSVEWRPLRDAIMRMVQEKLLTVPWVPADAVRAVLATPAAGPNNSLFIAYPIPAAAPTAPAWLDTSEKRAWWGQFAAYIQKARDAFNRQKLSEGLAIMDDAQFDSRMWNLAYQIARIASAPLRWAADGINEGVKDAMKTPLGWIIAGGIALAIAARLGLLQPRVRANPGRRLRRRHRR